jgi:hypothetical protein
MEEDRVFVQIMVLYQLIKQNIMIWKWQLSINSTIVKKFNLNFKCELWNYRTF